MILISKNDTLIDIIEKIQISEEENIILHFPLGHPILHNYLSLKIIKSKVSNKKLRIVTSDIFSHNIWKKLGIEYSILWKKVLLEKKPENFNLVKHNYSFYEYLKYEIKRYFQEIKGLLKKNKQINNIKKYSQKYKSLSNIWFLLGLLIFSILLFIFIFYFAISKTTIYITPDIYIKQRSHNFIFSENNNFEVLWNNKNIKIKSLEEKVYLTETYKTTGIDEQSIEKAYWNIMLFNLEQEEIILRSNTRFITDNGIIFESKEWISIPWAIQDNFWELIPGKTTTEVTAKYYDKEWKFIWKRGNIKKWEKLTLPWLEDNWEIIFAEVIEDFTWWNDNYISIISQEDIENTRIIFEQKLKNKILEALKNKVSKLNALDKTNYDILWVDNIIQYINIDINIANNLKVWDISEDIVLEWSITWKTYIYDKSILLNKLNSIVKDSILKWTENILKIDESSIRFANIIYREDSPLEIKATVEISTLISHNFLWSETYNEKIKNMIRWLKKDEAIKLLLNDKKISNVEIKIRPFFIQNISNIPQNIIFDIKS